MGGELVDVVVVGFNLMLEDVPLAAAAEILVSHDL